MTNKSKRQRGSRTHGGGSQKNRRGAGNRGGRGDAGRSKHEFHNHEDLGRDGFKGPNSNLDVETENIKDIDLLLYEAEVELESSNSFGSTEVETDGGAFVKYDEGIWISRTEASSIVDLTQVYPDADKTKLLSNGYLSRMVDIRADDCSREAKLEVKFQGGTFYYSTDSEKITAVKEILSKRFKKINKKGESTVNLEQYREIVNGGEPLGPNEIDEVLQGASSDKDLAYDILSKQVDLLENPSGIDLFNIMRAREFAKENSFDETPFTNTLERYFENINLPDGYEESIIEDIPDELTVKDILCGLEGIEDDYDRPAYQDDPELKQEQINKDQIEYLFAVDRGSQLA